MNAPTIVISAPQPVGESQHNHHAALTPYLAYMESNPDTVWTRAIVNHDGILLYAYAAAQPLQIAHVGLGPNARRKASARILVAAGFGTKEVLSHQIAAQLATQAEAYFYSARIVVLREPAPTWRFDPGAPPLPADVTATADRFPAYLRRHPHVDFWEAVVTDGCGTELYSPQLNRTGGWLKYSQCRSGQGPEVAAACARILALAGFGDQAELTAALAGNSRGLRFKKRLRRQPAPSSNR